MGFRGFYSPMKSLFVFLLLTAASASALDWKMQHLSLTAVPLQHQVEAEFPFTNTGDRTVTIKSVDTSCDCLEAVPSAHTFAPGEHGSIKARFNLRGAFGVLQRMIVVSTDDGQPATLLTVELTVPEIATLTPRAVEWKINAPATEATIDIVTATGVELTIHDVKPTSKAFQHRLEVVEPGRHFHLLIIPADMTKPANAAFRVYARAANGEEVVVNAYANVR